MSTQNFATLQMIMNILNGTTIPAKATGATNDGEGNNIPDTYAKKGGKIIPVGVYPPSSAGRTLVLGTYDGEVSVGDVALIMQLSGTTDWGNYQIGDLYEITAVNSNAVTLASSAIGNIFGTSGRYRVGDWVLSDNNASPASEYGGSWEQVENVFLYASGTNDVGATGGELTHTLTVEELPSQNQEVTDQDNGRKYGRGYGAGVPGYSISVTEVDNIGALMQTDFNSPNTPFSLMPPYRVTNFWRRVA